MTAPSHRHIAQALHDAPIPDAGYFHTGRLMEIQADALRAHGIAAQAVMRQLLRSAESGQEPGVDLIFTLLVDGEPIDDNGWDGAAAARMDRPKPAGGWRWAAAATDSKGLTQLVEANARGGVGDLDHEARIERAVGWCQAFVAHLLLHEDTPSSAQPGRASRRM